MPETAKMYGADATAPDQNIDAGTHYLRALMDRYKRYRDPLPRVIAAYNAGPAMVDKYRGVPPFRETRSYVSHVLGFLNQFGAELKNARRSAPLTQFAEASAAAQVLYLFPHRAKAFAIR
jgi:soluble lytic murein transglycosylase-like protein